MPPGIRLLGDCGLAAPDGAGVRLPTRKSWGLLAYLCQANGRDIPREELAALFWPRGSDIQARASLRQDLAGLRKALNAAGITGLHTSKDRVRFTPVSGLVDSSGMERLLSSNDREAWRRGVALYTGDFLGNLIVRSGPFEEWVWLERQRLKNLVQDALQKLLDYDLATNDAERAMQTAKRLLTIEPTHEQAFRALMRLNRRIGQRAEALRLFRMCAEVLRRDLDAEPSLETTTLADRIRNDTGVMPDISGDTRPRVAHLAVLCLGLGGTGAIDEMHRPEILLQAQTRLLQVAHRVVLACGGLVLPGLGDRIIAVFGWPETDRPGVEGAVQAALSLVAEPVSLSGQAVLWPHAGVASGPALFTPPDAEGAGAALVAAAVARAGALMTRAGEGQVIAGTEVASRLTGSYRLENIKDAPPASWLSGRVVRRGNP